MSTTATHTTVITTDRQLQNMSSASAKMAAQCCTNLNMTFLEWGYLV